MKRRDTASGAGRSREAGKPVPWPSWCSRPSSCPFLREAHTPPQAPGEGRACWTQCWLWDPATCWPLGGSLHGSSCHRLVWPQASASLLPPTAPRRQEGKLAWYSTTQAWPVGYGAYVAHSAAVQNEPARHMLTKTDGHDGTRTDRWQTRPAGETEATDSRCRAVCFRSTHHTSTLFECLLLQGI